MEVKVKVLYGDDGEDILCQYATFIRVLQDCCKKYGYVAEAVHQAIEICKNNNVLKEYLENREVEVMDIMTSLFDQDYVTAVHVQSEVNKAVEKVTEEKNAVINEQANTIDVQANKIDEQAKQIAKDVENIDVLRKQLRALGVEPKA